MTSPIVPPSIQSDHTDEPGTAKRQGRRLWIETNTQGRRIMLAWHFLPEDRKLRWGMREVVLPGLKLAVPPPLKMCRHGLHAGIRAIDALRYAPGPVVCRVELGGEILEDEDKCCATERTCVWLADASEVLHRFACWCAEGALAREREAGREPAAASWAAVQAKRDWLAGKITGQELAAAWKAAVSAAWSTAENVAWIAARSAARNAAKNAARSAARNDAWNAAMDAAENTQNEELTRVLLLLSPAQGVSAREAGKGGA